jgi:Nucleoside-diphosphate-sugar epimerases
MKALVTGANGYVGRQLTALLAELGHEVHAVVRSHPERLPSGVLPVVADLSQTGWTDALPDEAEAVIHLAQSMQYREFPAGAEDMFAINVRSTFELLEWARIRKADDFIFAGTGSVYPLRPEPQGESASCAPLNFYAVSKFSAEKMVLQYGPFFRTRVFRIFSVYGPGQKNMLLPRLARSVKSGNPITLAGGVGLRLSPIHVHDVCRILAETPGRDDLPEILNLAGPECLSIRELSVELGRCLETEPVFEETQDTPSAICGDVTTLLRHFPNLQLRRFADYAHEVHP